MSDEAFARRFYSDRAELIALGVPLHSQRDEFTGEELYTLRSENYFLPELELDDDELAALQTALYLLEGKFAYAEPLRLALQNLALGRPGFDDAADRDGRRASRCAIPTTRPRWPAGSRSSSRRSRSSARSSSATGRSRRDETRERTLNPYALLPRPRHLVRRRPGPRPRRRPHVPRLAHPRRHPLRDPPRARLPRCRPTSTSTRTAVGADWQIGDVVGEARIEVTRRHGLVGRAHATRRPGRSRTASSRPSTPALGRSPAGCCARTAARVPLEPEELRARCRRGRSRGCARRTRASRRSRRAAEAASIVAGRRSSGRRRPVAPERFGVLQALLAYLLAACGDGRATRDPGATSSPSASTIPPRGARGAPLAAQPRQLRRRLLRGLRRARAATRCTSTRSSTATRSGCAPRLTPLEARAIRLALEYRRPARSPPRRTRRSTACARSSRRPSAQFELDQTPEPHGRARRGGARRDALARRSRERRVVEIEYLKEGEEKPSTRARRAVLVRARAAELVHPHLGPHVGRRALASGSTGCARREADRRDVRAARRLRPALPRGRPPARVRYAKPVARWRVERGAPRLDGRLRARDAAASAARLADRRDPRRPRRGGRARAGGRPARDREARARELAARAQASTRAAQLPG